jgi:predicted CoA-substrate-specific enzyme activase
MTVRRENFLGIDIGSVSVAIAVTDRRGKILHTGYSFHRGRIPETLYGLLGEIGIKHILAAGYTSSSAPAVRRGIQTDARVAYITAARRLHPGIGSLLIIGAEKFGLVTFDEHGDYSNFRSNSSCAAGTGNFLDQQCERLNIPDIGEFSRIAYENRGPIPKIASRCAVFAKTDLIHAQQEGYTLPEICDGLSYGLAKNIVDTVLKNHPVKNIVAAGGVALNKSVIRHIGNLTGLEIIVDEFANIYGAAGAAMIAAEEGSETGDFLSEISDLIIFDRPEKKYFHPPLELKLSTYPDFASHEKYEYSSGRFPRMKPVEVDVYSFKENSDAGNLFLGIDIGSTSTKAVLAGHDREVRAGFYTRTSGRPLEAVQLIFESISDLAEKRRVSFSIAGAGTTGSGRKFTGTIIGADIILDEITAHAIAAYELDNETDTIIEIGGQDSKFTTMRKGVVTFSVMNNVCAAGTGSFIEEQARRLGCTLDEYSGRVEKAGSPMASDRCTVFMERDLNHYLMAGFSDEEILSAVLHSTCENYFAKVAARAHIGNRISFQGATAKNRALVAAMEQKLGKPVMVSRFCHLTGALGVAIELAGKGMTGTRFRGIGLFKKSIPVRSEVCELCTNHCKLKVAELDGQTEAYGFLCGRDYNINRYVINSRLSFQLMRKRKELYRFTPRTSEEITTIGIPAGVHLSDEILFWRKFFDLLSVKTVTSEEYLTAARDGKNLCGAEFCAPVAAMHGHVNYLKNKAEYIFLPVYIEETGDTGQEALYCYYTQFVSSMITVNNTLHAGTKILTPVLKYSQGEQMLRFELYRMFRSMGINDIGFLNISLAYDKAKRYVKSVDEKWKALYEEATTGQDDIHIVLLGRPYTVLSRAMNNSIPEIIEKMGIMTFWMDMLPEKKEEAMITEDLIRRVKWKFASKILHAAEIAAMTDGCYPVLITSFKCSPDSFAVEYFKEILDSYNKPYLILQLDEHDSSVGYETRIESAVRAFRNHHTGMMNARVDKTGPVYGDERHVPSGKEEDTNASWHSYIGALLHEASGILKSHSIDFRLFNRVLRNADSREPTGVKPVFSGARNLGGKTLLLPSWDPYVGPLLEALLRNSNINARLVDGDRESMKRSLSFNTGQCLPLNIIVQNAIDHIEANSLDPGNVALWIMKTRLSCNLSLFPWYMKKLLDNYGKGMEHVSVYVGDVIFYDFSLQTAINAYLAYMFGGYIRRTGCSIRPYELNKGDTDAVIGRAMKLLYDTFLNGTPKEEAIEEISHYFESVAVSRKVKPRVAIFGDLYVRDNDLMNQDLIRMVEDNGGEVITTPYSEYIKIIADPSIERNLKERRYGDYVKIKFLKSLIPLVEDKYRKYFPDLTGEINVESAIETDEWLNMFGLSILHRGESFENILKIHSLISRYPDLDLFIQTNPSYCCPSLVTEAMKSRIEEVTGVPVVTIEYDGTAGLKNEDIVPYLKYRKKKKVINHLNT